MALLATVAGTGALLAAWKSAAAREANAAAAQQPEPAEVVAAAVAGEREHRPTTTAIGTVLALRSISLRNELAGTVRYEQLTPGRIVGPGTVLVALDVSVEEAELRAQEAQAQLAQTTLDRMQRMAERRAASAIEVDNARAERDVALAQIARTKAIIARKTIRAPFRARVGIADVHIGQFLEAGTPLTTLQGVDEAENVDFSVAQAVAAGLHAGQAVRIVAADSAPLGATIVAVDARVDPATRTAMVRARIADPRQAIAPGASVRVEVPVGASERAVVVPASALRKGPAGDHVFVLTQEKDGKTRAHVRQVTSGPVLGDEIVIVDGLQAGERVAASGSFKLREAALVALAPSTPNGNHTAAR
ncbi:efflux RND transporter periplasmic adaptor subunit [Gemmatirosa kalamazoonensis]|uniref:efflux RND transporter periplasmic adaptor subunit n=1 Tax=Gemmatirosa kalamazoonensis TaxID=861299 RepID=UPI00046C8CE2|nr:efflux RND transporter periplasmic adaptor subunit [Gemmatirosa kalamazoonensis]